MGLFDLGSTFFFEGVAVMSDWNYGQIGRSSDLSNVTVGVLSLEPGADPQAVTLRIQETLSKELKVLNSRRISTRRTRLCSNLASR